MKTFKIILAALFISLAVPSVSKAQTSILSDVSSLLTNKNGNTAGSALLSLYTNYKADGKIDLSNTTNIQSIITLAQNIKGIKEQKDNTNFLSGLISGSKNLINNSNSSTALDALGQISSLDLSSLGKQAASAAATKAVSGLFSKIGSKNNSTASASETKDANATQASSILSGLFKTLGGK